METTKTRVLLAEDDESLGMLMKDFLLAKGFEVELCVNGKKAFDMFSKRDFDICILDIMMPEKDGFTVAKEIRMVNKNIPIIFLTAKSMKEDIIEGFNRGADDYITKPFNTEELLVRIQAVMRRLRPSNQDAEEFQVGLYHFNYKNQQLEFKGKHQKLTTKEAELLKLLCVNQNDVLDRTFALKAIWHDDSYFSSRSMDVYVTKLRKFLKDDPHVQIINIHGKGFKLYIEKA
ncbi:MAG: response regulator transcription factor [Bacteroidia bacterium]